MAAVVSSKLTAPPAHSQRGSTGSVHVAVYEVFTDVRVPGEYALQLAQQLLGNPLPPSNPDGSTFHEIPNPGARFFYSSDNGIVTDQDRYAEGTQGVIQFLNDGAITGSKFYNQGALAQDFETTELADSAGLGWQVVVTYRPPDPGMNERPNQLAQLLTGRSGIAAIPQPIPFGDNAVAKASVERWYEHRPMRYPVSRGYRVNNAGVPSNTLAPMRMPNGEEYPPLMADLIVDVLVISRNVENESYAGRLNADFANTCNDRVLKLGERQVPAFHAWYEITRTGKPIIRDNSTYYQAETRIVIHPMPPFVERQAWGTYYLQTGIAAGGTGGAASSDSFFQQIRPKGEDGLLIPRIPLNINGGKARLKTDGSSDIHEQRFSTAKKTNYSIFSY